MLELGNFFEAENSQMYIVFGILLFAIVLFAWGKLRHDIVSVICLLLLVFTGLVPSEESFLGFSNPAVITVAAILVVSHGLARSGLIEFLARWLMDKKLNFTLQLGFLCLMVCLASAFMNNVGALAMTMPLAIHIANKNGHSPSSYLMPIAFASLLGGMTTLIGTPPNIIISTIRAEQIGERYAIFDFAQVGASIAVVGLLFIVLVGWRLVPKRNAKEEDTAKFSIDDYITEVLLTENSKLIDEPHRAIYEFTKGNIQVLNIIRDHQMTYAPGRNFVFKENDIITIQGDPDDLKDFIEESATELAGKNEEDLTDRNNARNIVLVEAVVRENARVINRSASEIHLNFRFGVNLLAISRQNQKIRKRIEQVKFQVGDVLLIQGEDDKVEEALERMGCLPLADRGINLGQPKNIILSLAIFSLALLLIISNLLQVQVAFTLAALCMVLFRVVPLREIYTAIDWPIIILLGALLPLGTALETSGGAAWIAEQVLLSKDFLPSWAILAIILIVTMFLSDVINNAATVVLMAPIALSVASGMGAQPDAFLMAVAVGGSCAFLTPIGHQSNALVMGPGGYKFTDYLRLGAPMEIIILVIGIPLILFFWPL